MAFHILIIKKCHGIDKCQNNAGNKSFIRFIYVFNFNIKFIAGQKNKNDHVLIKISKILELSVPFNNALQTLLFHNHVVLHCTTIVIELST